MDEMAKLKKVEQDTKYREQICLGLDAALERAKQEEAKEGSCPTCLPTQLQSLTC
jgi:hypothetical protein